MKRPFLILGWILFAAGLCPANPNSEPWAEEIGAYKQADATRRPEAGGVLFIGGSPIRRWGTLAEDFPDVPVINRGFGEAQLADVLYYADRVVIPYRPRLIVVYAGETDLWNGKTPEAVLKDWKAFHQKIHDVLPYARIIFLSIHESPARAKIRRQVLRTNALIANDCATDGRNHFADVASPMLDGSRRPRPELFLDDQIQLSPAGYAIWAKEIAPFVRQ